MTIKYAQQVGRDERGDVHNFELLVGSGFRPRAMASGSVKSCTSCVCPSETLRRVVPIILIQAAKLYNASLVSRTRAALLEKRFLRIRDGLTCMIAFAALLPENC